MVTADRRDYTADDATDHWRNAAAMMIYATLPSRPELFVARRRFLTSHSYGQWIFTFRHFVYLQCFNVAQVILLFLMPPLLALYFRFGLSLLWRTPLLIYSSLHCPLYDAPDDYWWLTLFNVLYKWQVLFSIFYISPHSSSRPVFYVLVTSSWRDAWLECAH